MDKPSFELNGHGRLTKEEKPPRSWYITNTKNPNLLGFIGIFKGLTTNEGVFSLRETQRGLEDGFLEVDDPSFDGPRCIHIANVEGMIYKPGFADQIEGEWLYEKLRRLWGRVFRRKNVAYV